MRHNDRNGLVGLPGGENFIECNPAVVPGRGDMENPRSQAGYLVPTSPIFADIFRIFRLQGNMNGCDILR